MQLMHKHAKPLFCCSTWQLLKGAVGNAVDIAVRAGYRHIDGAWIYLNEEEIGTALEGLFKEGVVKREEIFITSKLWCDIVMCHASQWIVCFIWRIHRATYHEPAEVEPACRDTLKKLKLDYLDLYLVKWLMIFTAFATKKCSTVFVYTCAYK